MDNRPIGVFDSGLGGLSCVAVLTREMPGESILYFGDTARTPYGDKSPETIRYFTFQIADFLVSSGVKMLVIACNTISALCGDALRERYPDVPVVDIIHPTARHIAETTPSENTVGIIATKATVQSGVYERLLRQEGFAGKLCSMACPLFVPLIENGFQDGVVVETVARYYMDDFITNNGVDKLVLGCTHYPFIIETLRGLYKNLKIVNPSQIIAHNVEEMLLRWGMEASSEREGERTFYASDLSDTFLDMIAKINRSEQCVTKVKAFKEIYSAR